jgi:TonB-linked SusC/RagA family outer membrane protein
MRQESGQICARTTSALASPRGWRPAAIAALTLVASAGPLLAQQPSRAVSGTVVSAATLTPIQGADVRVQGSETSVLTDVSGRFRIADIGADQVTIVVRRIRFQPVTQTVRAGTTDLRLTMTEATVQLDEVVVTGTAVGTQQRSIGNSVSSISAAQELERSAVPDVGNLINARAAGVIVTSGSGRAGSGTGIAIRGRSTISLNQQPLLYIDGVRVANDVATGTRAQGGAGVARLNDIAPEDIESIEIIKGPAAATIYGTEASNGVIQVITKRGRASDKARWGLSLRQGTSWFQDPEGRLPTNYGKTATGEILSWNAMEMEKARGFDIWKNGRMQSYTGSVSGGTNLAQYYVSSTYDTDKGIEPNNYLDRFSGNANINMTPSAKIDVNARVGYVTGTTHLGSDYGLGAMAGTLFGSPILAQAVPLTRGYGFNVPPEVVWSVVDNSQELNRFTGSLTFNHRPTSWFTQRFIAGLDQTSEDNQNLNNFVPTEWKPLFSASAAKGSLLQDTRDITYASGDYSGTAKFDLTKSLVSNTSVGGQYYRKKTRLGQVTGREFPAPGLKTAAAAAIRDGQQDFVVNTTIGLYAQEQLGWNDRLFLTGAVRVDNNSAFGEDFDFATYPKIAATWVISEEPFWKLGFINTLKLRSAYGVSGLQPDVFTALRTFQPVTGTGDQAAVTPQLIGNPDLKPERGTELELGFDAMAFNRLSLEFTYFNKTTKDAILLRPVAPSLGFPGSQYVNIGEVSNHGLEARATLQALTRDNFSWEITGNVGTTKDKIENLGGIPFISLFPPVQRHVQGYPIGGFWAKRVTSATLDATGKAQDLMCDGGPGAAPQPCAAAPVVFLGTITPKATGAVANTFTLWKQLSLYALVDFKSGNKILDANEYARCAALSVCEVNVRPEKYDPRYVANAQNGSSLVIADEFIHDASFAMLREVSATYSLPDKYARYARATRASFTLAGRNLHRWTGFKGLDPESRSLLTTSTVTPAANPFQSTFDQAVTPTLAQFIATLNLTF